MEYKAALKQGLYEFENARNWYRIVCSPDHGGPGMHRDLVLDFIRTNALLIAPFTPHFSEYVWQQILGESSSIQSAAFPKPSGEIDASRIQQVQYMRGVVDNLRSAEATLSRRKGGKGKDQAATFNPSSPKNARIFVATAFPDWQMKCVDFVRQAWNPESGAVDDALLKTSLQSSGLLKDKRCMPFCQTFKVRSWISC